MPKLRNGSLAWPAGILAMMGGVLMIVIGLAGIANATVGGIAFASFTPTLIGALVVLGAAAIAVGLFSLRGVRIAWAFALSLYGTLFIVLLLATPTIRGIGAPTLIALMPALICGAIMTLYALAAGDY